MALERIGLGGVLTFDSRQAVVGMRNAQRATTQLRNAQGRFMRTEARVPASTNRVTAAIRRMATATRSAVGKLGSAIGKLGGAMRTAGLAGLPITAALGVGVKMAADFEQQMSAVSAITGASRKDMDRLTLKAKHMGATTVFSATQSAKAMEYLGRAGASTDEIINGLGGVMNAAASDGMDLASAADVVSKVVKGMGLQFKDANRIADMLAVTSASTNTDILGLGEAFTYAAPQARQLGVRVGTLSAILGVVADAGLKGSIGGTSFANMLVKIAKPTSAATGYMKKYNIQLAKNADGSLNVIQSIHNTIDALKGITDKTEKARIVAELYGIRGQKAFAAIEAAASSGKLEQVLQKVEHSQGKAEEMANKRLNNLKGQLTLLKSAMEGFAIETTGTLLGGMTQSIKQVADGIGKVVSAIQDLKKGMSLKDVQAKYGPTIAAIASGLMDAFRTINKAWTTVKTTIVDFLSRLTGKASPDLIRTITKWATIFLFVAAAVAPIMLALGGLIAFIAAVVGPAIEAIGVVIVAVVAIGTAALGVFGGAWALLRKDGESVGQTFGRIFNAIVAAIKWVINTAVIPFARAFTKTVMPAVQKMKVAVVKFILIARSKFQQLFGGIIQAAKYLAPFFKVVFRLLGKVVGAFVSTAIKGFSAMLTVLGPVLTAVKEVAIFLINGAVNGIHLFVKGLVKLADLVHKGNLIPPELRAFAKQPKFSIDRLLAVKQVQNLGVQVAEKKKPEKNKPDALSQALAKLKGAGAAPKPTHVNLKLDDKRKLDIHNCMNVDGRHMAVATARHKQEVNERAGFRHTPWQRRLILEQGATNIGGGF